MISSRKSSAISRVAAPARSYFSGASRALPMNSAISSDRRFRRASSSRGAPSMSMITSAGSGMAKSAMKSNSFLPSSASSSHWVSRSMLGRSALIERTWNTFAASRRRRVCSGGSRNTIQSVR